MFTLKTLRLAALAGLTIAALPAPAASDSALIDALVRKGVLTTKEAEEISADVEKKEKGAALNRLKINDSVTELKLYGDLRLRYQYDDKDAQLLPEQGGGANVSQQSRWRFRLRLNADFKLGEHWYGGAELQTAQASDSANQTYENGFDDYNIFISRAYLGWHNEWLNVTAGKMPNPFYTTDLLWDQDINPTGLSQTIAFHKLFAHEEEAAPGGYSKDGKGYKAPAKTESPWELSLIAGQFIFDDNPEFNGPDYDSSTDAYLFQTQLVGSYRFGGLKATVAPGWFTYVNGSLGGLTNSSPFNDNANVSGATRNLNILLLPGDLSFNIAGVKTKVFWDVAYNIEGRKRTEDIYNLVTANNPADPDDLTKNHSNRDDIAWHAGFQLGENKKAGDWSLFASWRQVGIAAIDPNINDSDWALSELNTQGLKTSISYNLTNFAIGTVSYYYAWNLRDNLFGGEATGGNGVADSNNIQVLQVDLSLKF